MNCRCKGCPFAGEAGCEKADAEEKVIALKSIWFDASLPPYVRTTKIDELLKGKE